MLIYYTYLAATIFASFFDFILPKKIRHILLFIVIAFLIVFFGFRYKLGVDWLFYSNQYIDSNHTDIVEYGYTILSTTTNILGINFFVFQFISAMSLIISLFFFFKRFSYTPIFCLSIFLLNSFIFNIEAIRQILSLSICIISILLLYKNNILTSLLLIVLASTIHISSLIVLLCVTFYLLPLVRNFIFLLSCVFLFISLFGYSIIELPIYTIHGLYDNLFINKLYWYIQNKNTIITYSLFMKLSVIFFYYHLFIYNKKTVACHRIIFSCLVSMLLTISIAGIYGTIISRIEIYFMPALICAISLIIHQMNNVYIKLSLLILSLIYFSISYIRITNIDYFQDHYIPYKNYLYIDNDTIAPFDLDRELSVKKFWAQKNGS